MSEQFDRLLGGGGSGDMFEEMDELEGVNVELIKEMANDNNNPLSQPLHASAGGGVTGHDKSQMEDGQEGQDGAVEGGFGDPPLFQSVEEILKERIECRLEKEIADKAKSSHAMRQALKDQETAQARIPVALALIDYLVQLKQNLVERPEEFYCSLQLPPPPPAEEEEKDKGIDVSRSPRRRKRGKKSTPY